jgi:hypothetical protein
MHGHSDQQDSEEEERQLMRCKYVTGMSRFEETYKYMQV